MQDAWSTKQSQTSIGIGQSFHFKSTTKTTKDVFLLPSTAARGQWRAPSSPLTLQFLTLSDWSTNRWFCQITVEVRSTNSVSKSLCCVWRTDMWNKSEIWNLKKTNTSFATQTRAKENRETSSDKLRTIMRSWPLVLQIASQPTVGGWLCGGAAGVKWLCLVSGCYLE